MDFVSESDTKHDWRTVKRRRNNGLTIRLDDDERDRINLMAARTGITPGAYVRQKILGADVPKESFRPPSSGVKADLANLLMHYGKIGSNINQIAKVLNSGGFLPLSEIEEQLSHLRELRLHTKALLKRLG